MGVFIDCAFWELAVQNQEIHLVSHLESRYCLIGELLKAVLQAASRGDIQLPFSNDPIVSKVIGYIESNMQSGRCFQAGHVQPLHQKYYDLAN